MKKFNNTPNIAYKIGDKVIWHSRSVAIVGIIIAYDKDERKDYVLLQLRSSTMDEPNKWGLPCGYLDWNETLYEAFVREVYEETTFDVEENQIYSLHPRIPQNEPIKINGSTLENRQNVSVTFLNEFNMNKEQRQQSIEKFVSNDETLEVKWVELSKAMEMDLSFKHQNSLQSLFVF